MQPPASSARPAGGARRVDRERSAVRRQTGCFHGDTQNRQRDGRETGYQRMLGNRQMKVMGEGDGGERDKCHSVVSINLR